MSPEIEEMLSKPLTVDTINTDGALNLIAAIFESIRKDYIYGKMTLLRFYGRDMTEAEFNQKSHEGHNSNIIRKYFAAKRAITRDYYGIGDSVDPEDIFSVWDVEVKRHLGEAQKYRVYHSEHVTRRKTDKESTAEWMDWITY